MAALMPQGKQQYFTAGGIPLVGGKVYTYAAGTTTPLATYTTSAGTPGTENTNPVILDSRGEASIFFSNANYKIVVKDSLDSTIWTQDNLPGDAAASVLASLAASAGSSLVGHIASGAGAVATTVQAKLRESVSVKDFGAVGDGTTDDTAAIQAAIDAVASAGGAVLFPAGNYLISSSLSITNAGITLSGTNSCAIWNGAASFYSDGSIIVKKSTMTSDAISINGGLRSTIKDIGILGQSGNTGGGIYLQDGQHTVFDRVSVANMGSFGIRIGPKTATTGNCNGWKLSSIVVHRNGSHGLYLYDEYTPTSPNINAGFLSGLDSVGNTGNGLHIENAIFNTYTGIWAEQNTGYGVSVVGSATVNIYSNFVINDLEANTAGNWSFGANAKHMNIVTPTTCVPVLDVDATFSSVIHGGGAAFRAISFTTSGSSLSNYTESAWTPADVSGAGLSLTLTQCKYTRIGRIVVFTGRITYPVTANTAAAKFSIPISVSIGAFTVIASPTVTSVVGYVGGTTASIFGLGGAIITNANLSGVELNVSIVCNI